MSAPFVRVPERAHGDPFAKRVRRGDLPENTRGDCVVYWSQSARRVRSNLALDFAIARAEELALPVVMLEEERAHNDGARALVAEGMRVNAIDAERRGIGYSDDREVLQRARIVITDEHPTLTTGRASFFVDGNGILPMRAFEKEQYSAKFFRDRARRLLPEMWAAPQSFDGSASPAHARLDRFIVNGLTGYATMRNKSPHFVSGMSPYLHFGHIGIYEVADKVLRSGAPQEDIDAFLEESIIRRELSFNMCFYRRDYRSLSALPDWARKTLDAHRNDRRKRVDDPVWDLAQRQLEVTGTMHGYLRMLWGKKLIEWSETPEEAQRTMIEMHMRYALDGNDPNTYAGILWCFGKHDRPWFPERPVFGTVRYMTSESTAKKVRLGEIERLVHNWGQSCHLP